MSFTRMLEESNCNFGAEQRIHAGDEHMLSVFRRLEKKLDEIMIAFERMGPKLSEFEGRIMKLELAVNELSASMKSNTEPAHESRERCLNLQFISRISSSIWTGDEIKGVGGNYIKVALVDETGNLVDSGPESFAEVHIFAFKGDVDDNEVDRGENGYFVDDIARERKAKKLSILVGDVQLKLNKGIGILTNIKFRSSSTHMSGVFKIGARVVDHFDGIVIQDAKTVPFKVKDYRGKYNEKHHPPFLSDEVWRLDNIGRGGAIHDRLKKEDFNTVEDFLIQLLKDSDGLKQLVDLPPKKWEATVKHALTCQLDEKVYCSISSEENKGIVFNAVGKLLGLLVESKYLALDKLSDEAKVNACKLDVAAFVHKCGLVPFADEASLLQQFPAPINDLHPTMSHSTIDYDDEVSEIGESHQANLGTSFGDVPSSSYPLEIDQYFDQPYIESLLAACDSHQNASFSDMLHESPAVSSNEVKKKLFFLFTITKWFLNFEKMAACDGNDNQKRRRIS